MGRKASKATDNIYYISRIKAAKENEIYTSREKAALKLGIERSRLARIELDQIEPYAEEVDIMATAYNAPHLCTDYCDNICPIGIHKLEEQAKHTEPESIERLVLKFLSSSQCMTDLSKILVNITQDGVIDKTEIHDLQDVFKAMDSVSENIEAIRFWIMSDPTLRSYFNDDAK
ncbi:MAG: helix-turn-helix domain-containing protein [Clostridium sp.]|nr:helix-turn-helix domain-containing protein [Clostridium sp.]MCM1398648.1 helix-turn-helix domain-containing protein [Clostridium sp.]MCM1459934.1 helix-turn-helix domain-containing protein [Bacteroides sp.]